MRPKVLILGGTTEATALATLAGQRGLDAVFSYAGRVDRPRPQEIPWRIGGFGGVSGLATFLKTNAITHVVDATHPFAAQMSRNASAACAETDIPLAALTRPSWSPQSGDNWTSVADVPAAVAALGGAARRIFLALGRLNLPAFATLPQHNYLLRLVDPPEAPIPMPHHQVVVSRGPFTLEGDCALLRAHGSDLVVCKNAGGTAARAKLDAARKLTVPVLMISRPDLPERTELATPEAVFGWLASHGADLGV